MIYFKTLELCKSKYVDLFPGFISANYAAKRTEKGHNFMKISKTIDQKIPTGKTSSKKVIYDDNR